MPPGRKSVHYDCSQQWRKLDASSHNSRISSIEDDESSEVFVFPRSLFETIAHTYAPVNVIWFASTTQRLCMCVHERSNHTIVAGGLALQSTRSDQKVKYVVSQATLSTETHRFYHMDGGRTRAAVHGMGPVLLSVVGGMLCGCGPVTVASKQRHEDTLSGLV